MEAEEDVKWVEKFQERKHLRVEKMQKKQVAELQAFRVRLEGIFNEKIKQRDRKFEMYFCDYSVCLRKTGNVESNQANLLEKE